MEYCTWNIAHGALESSCGTGSLGDSSWMVALGTSVSWETPPGLGDSWGGIGPPHPLGKSVSDTPRVKLGRIPVEMEQQGRPWCQWGSVGSGLSTVPLASATPGLAGHILVDPRLGREFFVPETRKNPQCCACSSAEAPQCGDWEFSAAPQGPLDRRNLGFLHNLIPAQLGFVPSGARRSIP